MKPWTGRLRKFRPFKAFNTKLRNLKSNILEATCIPFAGELLHFEEKPIMVNTSPPRQQPPERKAEARLDGLGRTMSRFNEGAGATSWLGVIPYHAPPTASGDGSDIGQEDIEVVPPQEDGQHQYHYRLRRIHLLDDQDEEEIDDAPFRFITPIPSVKFDIPDAPRKGEGTYSRYYAMLDRGFPSDSFDEIRQLTLDGTSGKAAEKAKRYPKLDVIFGQGAVTEDSIEGLSDPHNLLFSPAGPFPPVLSTGSQYKYIEETERDSTEIFINAGMDDSVGQFLAQGIKNDATASSSRNLEEGRFYYHHEDGSMLHLPSIDSYSASLEVLSHPRSQHFDQKPATIDSRSFTSRDLDDGQQPISVSISKLGSALFSYTPTATVRLPAAPPNTPWAVKAFNQEFDVTEPRRRMDGQQAYAVPADNIIRQSVRSSRVPVPDEYSFISFSTPSLLSLALKPETLITKANDTVTASHNVHQPGSPPSRTQSEFVTSKRPTKLIEDEPRSKSHFQTVKAGLPCTSKKVRIVDDARTLRPREIVTVTVPAKSPPPVAFSNGKRKSASASSFADDLNKALDALDKIAESAEMGLGLSSNAADKASFMAKLEDNGDLEFSATLPPSALMSPISKFSEGECTLNEPEPMEPPVRRRRKFGLGKTRSQQTHGVPLTRTKTRDYRDRQVPVVYRKLLEFYSMQYHQY